jgi:chromosomal replication initiation ATPase DnaA
MEDPVYTNRSGEFATARKGGIASDEIEFIQERARQGVPVSAIARMIGRAEVDVRAFAATPKRRKPPVPLLDGMPRDAIERASLARGLPPEAIAIMAAVAAGAGLEVAEVRFSCKRGGGRTEARQEAYHALHATGRYSMPMIASWFGLKGHSAVALGIQKHEARQAAGAVREAA